MLRRSHKKTRKGSKCEECRRRHIRCDQQHPSCINCQNSDRICTYRSVSQPHGVEAHSASSTSSNNHTPPRSGEETWRGPSSHRSPSAQAPDDVVNMAHLELFHHFTQNSFLFIDKDTAFTDQLKKTALSNAFSTPYLMHGILAFAARHLSTQVAPERSGYYLEQSTRLQTWAVANFNPAPREADRDTCVALFLFSSLLCIHGLADIALLHHLASEPFFIRFGQYFGLQRGVRTIIVDKWSQLRESEIQTIFQWCELLALRKGRGSECDAIRQLVTQSTDLSPAAAEACRLAIEQLQCILDEHTPSGPVPARQVYATLAWPLLISEKMIDLLVLRRPAALMILAYYGVTLDFCRDMWMVGQVGKHIVHAIHRHLGSSWASWLRWPCEAVGVEVL
ncbi:hypothetical protein F4859DRAFT_341206 [Xylaria cf. heliscus]|nr:hypothetical protein F4859DRAFT_341206 [Xylaria cf. heliscus]